MNAFVRSLLGSVLVCLCASASALNGADFGLSVGEVEAAYTNVSPDGLTRSYVSSGQLMPRKEAHYVDSECKYLPGQPYGGHCIDLAGGGAFGEVAEVKFYWRKSGNGHNAPWEPCNRTRGCRGFNAMIWPDGRVKGTFLIYHVDSDGDRDLRMDVIFKSIKSPPVERGAKVYQDVIERNWSIKN